jgi:hypothetical protein
MSKYSSRNAGKNLRVINEQISREKKNTGEYESSKGEQSHNKGSDG